MCCTHICFSWHTAGYFASATTTSSPVPLDITSICKCRTYVAFATTVQIDTVNHVGITMTNIDHREGYKWLHNYNLLFHATEREYEMYTHLRMLPADPHMHNCPDSIASYTEHMGQYRTLCLRHSFPLRDKQPLGLICFCTFRLSPRALNRASTDVTAAVCRSP